MVRINLVSPVHLSDQHLIAEYNEILMLFGTVEKHPEIRKQPKEYTLGTGHITFFKDKLVYLKRRHETLQAEMRERGFVPTKRIDLRKYPEHLHNDWTPTKDAIHIIIARIAEKIDKKPDYYRYRGERKPPAFFHKELEKAKRTG